MLTNLSFTDLRGQSRSYDLFKVNEVIGRTGGGKSTVKEAISFIFAGTDSLGNQAPTHLITAGRDKTLIQVTTEKAKLSRSLTVKKNSTFKLERGGISSNINQKDMKNLLCSSDLFLSVFLPGYFFRLSEPRRDVVLHEVLPEVDRPSLLAELTGLPLEEVAGVDFSGGKRPDRLADEMAEGRRSLQKEMAGYQGQLKVHEACVPPDQAPVAPADQIARLAALKATSEAWVSYNAANGRRAVAENMRDGVVMRNSTLAQRRAEIDRELAALQEVHEDLPDLDGLARQIEELTCQLRSPPAATFQDLPDSDACPTCGQVVGTKHREMVKNENARLKAENDRGVAEVKAFNEEIGAKADKIRAQRTDAKARFDGMQRHNMKVQARRQALEGEKAKLVEEPVPAVMPEPVPPEEVYDEAEEKVLAATIQDYHTAVAVHSRHAEAYDKAQAEVERLAGEIARLEGSIERYTLLESGCRQLPKAELERQAELLAMSEYRLVLDDGPIKYVRNDGMPYELLSDGEALRAAVQFSLKLASLMQKSPVSMLFIDNSDLMDTTTFSATVRDCVNRGMQVFFARVDHRQPQAEVRDVVTLAAE